MGTTSTVDTYSNVLEFLCCRIRLKITSNIDASVVLFSVIPEIGSIVRSLGCFPTEAELHELLAEVEEEEPTGYINLEKFLPVMTKVLLHRSYQPIPEDVLLHAFEALDENKCGYITKEELVKYLTEEGEPFTQEEMEDMLSTALDPETNTVHYRDYISMLVVDET
uniref:EF-hand calcium binding domain 2 n=1 Tax=Otus sunia TaxID=257818 RepID=A0A8C8A6B9_9STRI